MEKSSLPHFLTLLLSDSTFYNSNGKVESTSLSHFTSLPLDFSQRRWKSRVYRTFSLHFSPTRLFTTAVAKSSLPHFLTSLLSDLTLYNGSGKIWLSFWLLWTIFLYLVPFSRYSTSKFLGFDLWPLKVIWGQKNSYHSRAHIWLPILLLWTPCLYLVPFSRWCRSKFRRSPNKIADFDLLKVKVKFRFLSIIEKAPPLTKPRQLRYCASQSVQPFRLYPCQRA